MKHAGPATLASLDTFLEEIRERQLLREKSAGTFYLKSKAFLHFHEDPAGVFADVKLDLSEFVRFRVTTRTEQRALLTRIDRSLAGLTAKRVTAPPG